jgi:hypothetical protein
MGFLKGIFNLMIMLVLGICLFVWLSFSILDSSMLSLEKNVELMETTSFTQEVTDALLERYHMSMNELNFDEDVVLKFVTDSGEGVLGYVFLETDTMPTVDVTFLKDYVTDQISIESQKRLDGNVNMNELLSLLRELPEGNSVSLAVRGFTEEMGLSISQSDIDTVANVFIENKDEEDSVLLNKIIESVAVEALNLNEMNTNLSLQSLFDKLTDRNVFTLLRDIHSVIRKDVMGYLPLMMLILLLILVVVEFRVGTSAVWIALSMIVAIVPLQLIRVADILIEQDFLDVFAGLESYKEFMMTSVMDKLNFYSILFLVLIVVLFIVSRIFSNKVDSKIEAVEEKRHSRFVLPRIAIFLVLAFGLYLNGNAAKNYNMELVNELNSIHISEFDINSVDLILREELNIDFDF